MLIDKVRFDQDRLADLALLAQHHSAQVVNDLIVAFFADAQKLLDDLKRDLELADYKNCKELCHQMKGLLANFGLRSGAQTCGRLKMALESDSDGTDLVIELANEIDYARSFLDKFFDEPQ